MVGEVSSHLRVGRHAVVIEATGEELLGQLRGSHPVHSPREPLILGQFHSSPSISTVKRRDSPYACSPLTRDARYARTRDDDHQMAADTNRSRHEQALAFLKRLALMGLHPGYRSVPLFYQAPRRTPRSVARSQRHSLMVNRLRENDHPLSIDTLGAEMKSYIPLPFR
ncbi:hypothetical protein LshimejAT787_1601570 [Lyophyllum shimeji]|uniref:Uncharacterized protein n=1 Tax=Lyophyllum shimeji TaxID=47721 RepID=A0A9P3PWF0_LYOSH|nr:hypothetical protein LshimejAT787_1601570 [Lyophyllum shimeji]